MEIGPRNGGNCIPEVIHNYTGVNMVGLAVEAAMGNCLTIQPLKNEKYYAYYALHSSKKGQYNGFELSPNFKGRITQSYIFKELGDAVGAFHGSNATIGIILLEFDLKEDMDEFFFCPSEQLSVNILNK